MQFDPHNIPPHIFRLLPPEEQARLRSPASTAPILTTAPARQAVPVEAVRLAAVQMFTSDSGSPTLADTRAEKIIQEEIAAWLRGEGYEFLVQRMDAPTSGARGWPDITFAAKNGRAVALEVKNAKGKLSPWQRERIASMQGAGWVVEVVRSLRHAQDFVRAVERGAK